MLRVHKASRALSVFKVLVVFKVKLALKVSKAVKVLSVFKGRLVHLALRVQPGYRDKLA